MSECALSLAFDSYALVTVTLASSNNKLVSGSCRAGLEISNAVQTINAAPAAEDLPANEYGVTFTYPTGLASDEAGNLYAADTHAGRILKITPDGMASPLRRA